MITLNIEDKQIQEAFQKQLDEMLKPGQYSNPIKSTLDRMFSYSNNLETHPVGKQIKEFVETQLQMPAFQLQLGQAIAAEMARRAVDAMEKKK